MKQVVLRFARALGLFELARRATRSRLKVLCYHGIWTGPPPHFGDCLFMAATRFERRLQWLAEEGYRVLPLEVGLMLLEEGQLQARDIVITIDDAWHGTWLHMLPALKHHGFASTLYVPTSEVVSQEPLYGVFVQYLVARAPSKPAIADLLPAGQRPDSNDSLEAAVLAWVRSHGDASARQACVQALGDAAGVDVRPLIENRVFGHMNAMELQEAAALGVDLQLHTHTHSMHGMDPSAVRREIELNRTWMAKVLGRPAASFTHFCYPSGEHQESVRGVLRECGIVSATTTEPGSVGRTDDRLAMRRILDCESISLEELEARLCGFWGFMAALRRSLRPGTTAL
jgi:peptidoglycan/xylan/chitin deacetylase (PgdA/CDA1 family)